MSQLPKPTVGNYRECKDYREIVAAASRILRLLRFHAHDLNLKPSITVYQHRGHRLRCGPASSGGRLR
jgi:hypothetical protein